MSNLALRALSALVRCRSSGALILWQQPLGFGVLVLLVSGLALHECAAMMLPARRRRSGRRSWRSASRFTAALYLAPGYALVAMLGALISPRR